MRIHGGSCRWFVESWYPGSWPFPFRGWAQVRHTFALRQVKTTVRREFGPLRAKLMSLQNACEHASGFYEVVPARTRIELPTHSNAPRPGERWAVSDRSP